MQAVGIIPARYQSTRFPGKPLVNIAGKSMIQRVYEQAKKAKGLQEVVVATDDERIQEVVVSFGGKVVMTAVDHLNGTSRCMEAAEKLEVTYDVIVNIQGDEPYVDPAQIELLLGCFQDQATEIATLVKQITNVDDLSNPNKVRVVRDINQFALYFSRSVIPFQRDQSLDQWLDAFPYFKHIGLYAYRTAVLKKLVDLPPSSLEKAENLEQLRWLENGFRIKTAETTLETQAVDVPEDLERLPKED